LSQDAYDQQRVKLAEMFINNYKKYVTVGYTDYSVYGPHVTQQQQETTDEL
jgi:hypothetical protein